MRSPVAIAVIAAVAAVVIFVALGAAIGGSYWLTLHTLHVAQANHANSNLRQAKSALASAKGECTAMEALDHAKNGIRFIHANIKHPAALYLQRMTDAIHRVVLKSGCSYILRGHFPPGDTPPGG